MNRCEFLTTTSAAAGGTLIGGATEAKASMHAVVPSKKPNIILYLSDQFRWDFLGANRANGSTKTPNLDAMAGRGKNFTHAVTNQPVCAPARSVVFTSRYATETGVWHNGAGLREDLPTLAGELRKAGYTANLIGKWHLSPGKAQGGGPGFVPPEFRGGFLDLWEGANAIENTSHPYYGSMWDGGGNEIKYQDRYRVDFLTDRAESFLRQKHDKPFFLFVSQLEPHHQNDLGRVVGPKGSAERFANSHVPHDLRSLPGNWQQQLPDYYGACESIDASVGRLQKVLEEEQLAEDTVFVFFSDHGCHFQTRNKEYKRSAHNSSIRIPLLIDGPGFHGAQQIPELTGIINIAPTLLEAVGVPVPSTWKGRSMMPLLGSSKARESWKNRELIQISESMTARAIRTPEWTYCVAEPSGAKTADSKFYQEYQLYDQRNDPCELTNLAGRKEYEDVSKQLWGELLQLLAEAGEQAPELRPAPLYP